MTGRIIILVVLIIILVGVSFAAFGQKKQNINPNQNPDQQPGPVRCDPGRPGYTMNGDFSVQCAGGTAPCKPGTPGYDVNGYLQSYCGVPCDPNNPAYDVNGNFNILCGGGVGRKGNISGNEKTTKIFWNFDPNQNAPAFNGNGIILTGNSDLPVQLRAKIPVNINFSFSNGHKQSIKSNILAMVSLRKIIVSGLFAVPKNNPITSATVTPV